MSCMQCGTVQAAARFCRSCGKRLPLPQPLPRRSGPLLVAEAIL